MKKIKLPEPKYLQFELKEDTPVFPYGECPTIDYKEAFLTSRDRLFEANECLDNCTAKLEEKRETIKSIEAKLAEKKEEIKKLQRKLSHLHTYSELKLTISEFEAFVNAYEKIGSNNVFSRDKKVTNEYWTHTSDGTFFDDLEEGAKVYILRKTIHPITEEGE